MKVGDYIKCRDREDLVETMCSLADFGIETESCYERKGRKGFWLEVTKVEPLPRQG